MAVVVKGPRIRPTMPVGYERGQRGTVTQDVTQGDLLVLGAAGWSLSTAADPANKRGFAAQDYVSGRADCSILTHGNLDGYTGLIAGVPLYPAAAGALETVAVVGFTGLMHAISATEIEFTL